MAKEETQDELVQQTVQQQVQRKRRILKLQLYPHLLNTKRIVFWVWIPTLLRIPVERIVAKTTAKVRMHVISRNRLYDVFTTYLFIALQAITLKFFDPTPASEWFVVELQVIDINVEFLVSF